MKIVSYYTDVGYEFYNHNIKLIGIIVSKKPSNLPAAKLFMPQLKPHLRR